MVSSRTIKLCLFIFLLLGCGQAAEPVSLPIPFTGALTPSTDSFVENGFSLDSDASQSLALMQKKITAKTLLGPSWALFSEIDGVAIGVVSRDVSTCVSPADDGVKQSCVMSTTLALDDGSTVSSSVQYYCYPFNLDPDPLCESGEPGSLVISRSCIGSGVIQSAAGGYVGLAGNATLNYVGLEQRVLHADGTQTFCKTIRSNWQVR